MHKTSGPWEIDSQAMKYGGSTKDVHPVQSLHVVHL